MRIVVIGNYATNLWLFRRSLLEALVEQGHEVMASAPDFDDDLQKRLTDLGITCYPTELKRNGVNPLEDIAYFLRIRSLLKELKPDLTIAYAMKPVIYGSLAAWSLGVRRRFSLITGLGYTFGGASRRQRLLNGLVNMLCRLAFAANERIFVQNPDDAALLIERRLLPAQKVVVVNGSGVPLQDFEQAPMPEGPITFLFIARLMVEKGILEFVEAARRLKPRHPEARFQILGPFPFDSNASSVQPEQLEAWIDEGAVDYLGETKDVRPYIRQAHVFVLPSFYREGTPRSTLEAMAMGRPIITADSPGCRETVIDGKNGFLVPIRDHQRLADAMERFIDDPESLIRSGLESRKIAEDRYDVRKVNGAMLATMGILPADGHRNEHAAAASSGWIAKAERLKAS
jgi:glycosyltransferase involved in cell wall biosynthesis